MSLLSTREGARAIAFTPQGEALGRQALAGIRALGTAVAALREARPGNAVTIATAPSVAARWLLPRMSALEARHPWIELSIMVDQRLADPGQDGADLSLRMGRGPWRGVDCAAFMDDALYPVMNRAYWEEAGRPRAPDELAGLRLLHDRDPNASWAAWQEIYPTVGLDLRTGPRFSSSDLVLRAAAEGLGVALARDRLAAGEVRSGALIRPFGDLQVALPDAYWIVRPEDAPSRAAVTAVMEWLQSEADGAATIVSSSD